MKPSYQTTIANETIRSQWFSKSFDDMYEKFEKELKTADNRLSMMLARKANTSPESINTAENILAQLRRFKQLKEFVIWMSQVPKFGKYCYYGCWCLPGGGHEFVAGHGEPRDEIDRACKIQWQCYECSIMDKNTRDSCSPDRARYRYEFSFDENDPDDVSKHEITLFFCEELYF